MQQEDAIVKNACDKQLPPHPPQEDLYDCIRHLLGYLEEQNAKKENGIDARLPPLHSNGNRLERRHDRPNSSRAPPKARSRQSDLPLVRERGSVSRPISEGLTNRQRRHLLNNASNLEALFDLAHRDAEFSRIYKSIELPLIRGTLQRSRPEEWELREMGIASALGSDQILKPGSDEYFRQLACAPSESGPTWTAKDYLEHYAYEMAICAYVTGLILVEYRKRAYIDLERHRALENGGNTRGKEMQQAFRRVWTFCRIFGPCKGREDDTAGQQAWLAGYDPTVGLNCHRHLGGFHSEVLDLPPPSFGHGNRGGLRRVELEDMMAIWKCLENLIHSRLSRAPSDSLHGWQTRNHSKAFDPF